MLCENTAVKKIWTGPGADWLHWEVAKGLNERLSNRKLVICHIQSCHHFTTFEQGITSPELHRGLPNVPLTLHRLSGRRAAASPCRKEQTGAESFSNTSKETRQHRVSASTNLLHGLNLIACQRPQLMQRGSR